MLAKQEKIRLALKEFEGSLDKNTDVKKLKEALEKMEKTEQISKFLKSVYGKDVYSEKIEKLSSSEFQDLCKNVQNGIPIAKTYIALGVHLKIPLFSKGKSLYLVSKWSAPAARKNPKYFFTEYIV